MRNIQFYAFLVIGILAFETANAQFYIGANVGYENSFNAGIFGINRTITNSDSGTSILHENIYGNVGNGLRYGLKPGIMFNDYFGFELGAYYFDSNKLLVQDTTVISPGVEDKFYRTYTESWHLRLNPSLVFKGGDGALKAHSRIGLVIPVAGSVKATREANDALLVNNQFVILNYQDPNNPENMITADLFDLEAEFSGQFSIGYEAAVGATFDLGDRLSVFAEIFFTHLRIRRATSTVKKAVATMSNGEEYNILPLLSLGGVYEHTEFLDDVNITDVQTAMDAATTRDDIILPNGAPWNPIFGNITDYGTTPEKAHKLNVSDGDYSSSGINIGVIYKFGSTDN